MSETRTQKKRKASATWLVDAALRNKRTRKLGKHWQMTADAADRRVEMRKSRWTNPPIPHQENT